MILMSNNIKLRTAEMRPVESVRHTPWNQSRRQFLNVITPSKTDRGYWNMQGDLLQQNHIKME